MKSDFSAIVAMNRNNVIAINGKIPWYHKKDLKNFRQLTTGKIVVMGNNTFISLKKPLKDRYNIVITSGIPAHTDNTAFGNLSFIKKIREFDSKVLIVIMSAYDNKNYLMEAIKLNLFEYIIKPISKSTFQNTIFNVLEKLKNEEKIILKNDYIWDIKNEKLFFNTQEIILTKNEMILFKNFCFKNEKIFTFEEISELIYPLEDYNINKIRMLIKRLKKKLNHSDTLENVHNIGYRFKKFE